jgi:predicted unusual protein kinase regulating ubiquinone biosynthesis (AarF/ABC1/UbiB family)
MPRSIQVFSRFFVFLFGLVAEEAAARVTRSKKRNSPRAFRDLLEGLGGAFIKIGQFLSMRSDILPPAYCKELTTLYDKVPPFPSDEARAIVERELKKPIDALFSSWDDVPVGAASFGQVHLVTLRGGDDDGQRAAVKICRPGSGKTIDTDGRLAIILAHMVDLMGLLGRIEIVPVLRDAVKWTRKEIQYLQEGKNADHIHELSSWNPRQRIPYVYWDRTTERVLTMEFLDGIAVSEIIDRVESGDASIDDELADMACDRVTLARNVWQTFLLQTFVGGVFHGDPHPGNIIVLPENTVGMIDIGLLGRLNEEQKREQGLCLQAVSTENIERLFIAILDILDAPRGLLVTGTYDNFSEEADSWLDACDNQGAPMEEKTIQRLVAASMTIARQVGLVMDAQTILFFKALLTVDAVVLRMHPDFDYKKESQRALRIVRMYELEKRYRPGAVIDASLLVQLLVGTLPAFVESRLQDYEQGQRQIYRKLNVLPAIGASVMRALAWAAAAIGVVALLDTRGWLARLWEHVPRENIAPVLDVVGRHLMIAALIVVVSFSMGRSLHSRSLVKVQKEA